MQASTEKNRHWIEELKPKTRREWIKLAIDVVIMALFIAAIAINAESFNLGFQFGKQYCMAHTPINFTFPNVTP